MLELSDVVPQPTVWLNPPLVLPQASKPNSSSIKSPSSDGVASRTPSTAATLYVSTTLQWACPVPFGPSLSHVPL